MGKAEKKDTVRIYCGPSIRSELKENTIFSGELPDNVKGLSEKIPEISNLMVVPRDLNIVKNKIHQKGTKENFYYLKILESLGGQNV